MQFTFKNLFHFNSIIFDLFFILQFQLNLNIFLFLLGKSLMTSFSWRFLLFSPFGLSPDRLFLTFLIDNVQVVGCFDIFWDLSFHQVHALDHLLKLILSKCWYFSFIFDGILDLIEHINRVIFICFSLF